MGDYKLVPVGRPQIREVFVRNGFTIAPDRDDLEDRVYEAAFELLELAAPAVQGEPVAWLAECMRSDFKKPLQALHLSPVLADDTCRHWKSRGCDVSLLPLYTTPQPAEQQPKCMTCSDSGIVGHSMLCPACGPESTGRQQAAPDVEGLLEALEEARRELNSCQSVIHYAGGFDPAYVTGAQAALVKIDAALAAQRSQGGEVSLCPSGS